MAVLKWFEKVERDQTAAQHAADRHQSLDRFDFACLTGKSWLAQRFSRFVFRVAIPTVFWILRLCWPILRLGRLVIISRYADVQTVLANKDQAFPVLYGPEMQELGGGTQGVLGMDGPPHTEFRHGIYQELGGRPAFIEDLANIRQWSREIAEALLDAGGGEIDVCRDLITRTATEVCCRYMGLSPSDPDAFAEWSIAISSLLFADPIGDEKTGQQSRIASVHLNALVDDAIARSRRNSKDRADAPLIHRLLVHAKMDAKRVRATIVGLATGFVPTNTLAAGNILEELLSSRRQMRDAKLAAVALARARQEGKLEDEATALHNFEAVLLTAARRNPALSPGIWRWSPDGGAIARAKGEPYQVRPGSILLVSILSALRDSRMPAEIANDPHRSSAMIFGYGPHECLGREIALAQITEVFAALLTREDLATAKGKAGRMWRAGPFPIKCQMTYHELTAGRALIVIGLPVHEKFERDEVQQAVEAIGNPMKDEYAATLTKTGIISFASLNVIEAGPGLAESVLLIELNGDGSERELLTMLVSSAHGWLGPILAYCTADGELPANQLAMVELLASGIHHLHRKPWGTTGLHFDGLGELSTRDIDRQYRLAKTVREMVQSYLIGQRHMSRGMRPMHLLQNVRRILKADWYTMLRDRNRRAYNALDKDLRTAIIRPSRKRLSIADWEPPSNQLLPVLPMLAGKDSRALVLSFLFTWSCSGFSLLFWLHPDAERRVAALLMAALAWLKELWANLVEVIAHSTPMQLAVALWHKVWAIVCHIPAAICWVVRTTIAHHWDIATVLFGGLGVALGVFLAVALLFLAWIRLVEMRDSSDGRIADFRHVQNIAAREDAFGHEQNHIIAVMPFKPGIARRLSFALTMWGIKQTVTYWFRPGYVVTMGTIHKARWFRVRGTNQFVFLSNYDGSWESYLEDFITRAHPGQTAAWSHGIGFPPTRFLVLDGARDGDRFKRWVRRQQRPSQAWYSRFPHLTMKQIQLNAMIEDGMARAASDTDARRWLSYFGSAQREVQELEANEAQSLAFTGFGTNRYATALLLRLPETPDCLAQWLKAISSDDSAKQDASIPPGRLSFGDVEGSGPHMILGLTARGLELAGLREGEGLDQLPAAFRMGMRGRQRILGDKHGETWRWHDAPPVEGDDLPHAAHGVLMIYHAEPLPARGLATRNGHIVERHAAWLTKLGGEVIHMVECAPPVFDGRQCPEREHFGFRDGISQPVVRGTRRARRHDISERDLIAPGELLLGYRNDQGYVSPSVTVGAQLDPAHNLPTLAENKPNRFPFFGNRTSEPERRDFGRNGTFLVLRQLDQHVEGFRQALEAQAEVLNHRYPLLAGLVGQKVDADWVAAKVIGRWKDGTSLIRRPQARTEDEPIGEPDNDFTYAIDDPRGLACPLGSHIRRTNPRDSLEPGDELEQRITNRHRILRRGRSYDYDADRLGDGSSKKGLLFAALCSDLERQFEFVQSSWVNASSFHGLVDEADPLLGNPETAGGIFVTRDGMPDEARPTHFTIPTPVGPATLEGLKSYVELRAGGYFFLPSRSAIKHLLARFD